jgi:nucleotide-binding universal stress UspA family protein
VVTVNPDYRQNRAEDLVCVDTHVGGDPVQQRGAEKEAVAVERLKPPVHHHLGARVGTGPYVTGDPITVLSVPDSGPTIADYARDQEAELIIIPSHGYHGIKRLVLGSVAEGVIQHAKCSVLVLRRSDAE